MSYADRLDIRDIAQEWRDVVEEIGANVPDTEGMSYGEVADATEAFLLEAEQAEKVAKYVALCEQLGCDADPDSLERNGDDYGPSLILASDFAEYAQELADDIGALSTIDPQSLTGRTIDLADRWPFTCIDWERAARDLSHDYTMVTFDGRAYYTEAR